MKNKEIINEAASLVTAYDEQTEGSVNFNSHAHQAYKASNAAEKMKSVHSNVSRAAFTSSNKAFAAHQKVGPVFSTKLKHMEAADNHEKAALVHDNDPSLFNAHLEAAKHHRRADREVSASLLNAVSPHKQGLSRWS